MNQGVFVLMDSMRNVMVHVCYQMIVLVNMVAFRMQKERRFILNARHGKNLYFHQLVSMAKLYK